MALKDWKITRRKDPKHWTNKDKTKRVFLGGAAGRYSFVEIMDLNTTRDIENKSFKTRSEAMAYAKRYMSSHQNSNTKGDMNGKDNDKEG